MPSPTPCTYRSASYQTPNACAITVSRLPSTLSTDSNITSKKGDAEEKCCYSWAGSEAGQFKGEESLTKEVAHAINCM
jgi:hypothetical protein